MNVFIVIPFLLTEARGQFECRDLCEKDVRLFRTREQAEEYGNSLSRKSPYPSYLIVERRCE